MTFFKTNSDDRFGLRQKCHTEEKILEFLVNFFDDKALPQFDLVKKKNFSKSKTRRFLLVLDNCESLIDKHGDDLCDILAMLQDKCSMLKILVVSRNQLGSSEHGDEI